MDKIGIHFCQVEEAMSLVDADQIRTCVDVLDVVRKNGKHVYICGNGGSHSTAGHFANDLTKMCHIKASCIGNEAATVFAYGNDDGWSLMFSEAIAGRLEEGDCVVGISCSGNSENVIKALELAVSRGAFTIGFTGMNMSSKIIGIGLDAAIVVPVSDIRVQEDMHLMICHAVARELQDGE